jgi:hypothetical protein
VDETAVIAAGEAATTTAAKNEIALVAEKTVGRRTGTKRENGRVGGDRTARSRLTAGPIRGRPRRQGELDKGRNSDSPRSRKLASQAAAALRGCPQTQAEERQKRLAHMGLCLPLLPLLLRLHLQWTWRR